MEPLLASLTQQAMNYAIRSGIAITTTYALKQSSRLLSRVEDSVPEREELRSLRDQLEGKIRILGPAIDLVELISARGNSSLETAVTLTKFIRYDMQTLGQQIAAANDASQAADRQARIKRIISDLKTLLSRIEDAVPLINLAITTSGVNLSSGLPPGISPSRLLQASTFVTAGDSQYTSSSARLVQIGPTFTLSLYMLFAGHVRPRNEADVRQTTWKEVMHKARVKLVRLPLQTLYDMPDLEAPEPDGNESDDEVDKGAAQSRADEFAYQMLIIEDRDDGRFHSYEDDEPLPSRYGDVETAGIREPLPIHEISKIFYADTGKILNIGEDMGTNSPVLLLKRDLQAIPPRRMLERREIETLWDDSVVENDFEQDDAQSEIDAQIQRESRANSQVPEEPEPEEPTKSVDWRLPADLDPEWLAFEVFADDPSSDSESDTEDAEPLSSPSQDTSEPSSTPSQLSSAMSKLKLSTPSPSSRKSSPRNATQSPLPTTATSTNQLSLPSTSTIHQNLPQIRTSLSLLETMLRLLSLQQFQQSSHLSIPDELLSFFLSEATSTTGAAHGDEVERRNLRTQARHRVGFDPYDESPIKRRGEDYQRYRGGASQDGSPRWRDEEGVDGHFVGHTWETGWSSPDVLDTGRRTIDEGYVTEQRLSSEPAQTPRLDWREAKAKKGKASSVSPNMGGGRPVHQSPSVRAKQRLDNEKKGSPLTRVESAEAGS